MGSCILFSDYKGEISQLIKIAKIELVENDWKELGIAHKDNLYNSATLEPTENFTVGVINTDESTNYNNSLSQLNIIRERDDYNNIDEELITQINTSFEKAGKHLEECRFRQSIRTSMALANSVNKYLEVKSPWKKQVDSVSTTLWTCSLALSALAIMTYPFLPFSAPKLFSMLGFEKDIPTQGWNVPTVVPGTPILKPSPLFKKLDDNIAKEEIERMVRES